MFVHPTRAQDSLLATVAICCTGLVACSDPEQLTDLRPEGPPEVLTVLVANDADHYLESATFCKLNDEKRPGQVGLIDLTLLDVCDADLSVGAEMVTDALPTAWYVRIVFDELLDPDIEDLSEVTDSNGNGTGVFVGSIASTRPVTLTCGGNAVPYDGYYSPSGNYVTWPLGPSLVVKPIDPTAIPA